MGFYRGPKIVTDGLITLLDAANQDNPVTRNLYTYTNDLANANWSKSRCQLTASATTAPDGTNTAYALNITDSTGLVRLGAPFISSSIGGGPYTFSFYVKQNNCTAQLLDLGVYNGGQTSGTEPSYNILNNFAVTGSQNASTTRTVTSVGNGWYRVATTTTITSSAFTWQNFIDIENGTGTKTNGTGIYIWGPQFEYGTTATTYQAVNTTTRTWPNRINLTSNASLITNPTYDTSNNGCIVFNGISNYAQLTNQSFASTSGSSFTIGVWFKRNNTTPVDFDNVYIMGINGDTNARIWMIFDDNNNGRLTINYYSGSGADYNITLDANQNTTQWHYAVQVIDKVNLQMRGYYDGVLKGTSNITNMANVSTQTGTLSIAGTNYADITIAQFQIYNRALSASEILQNYNATKSRFGL